MEIIAIKLVAAAVPLILTKLSEMALPYFGGDITEKELHDLKNVNLPKIQTVIKVMDNINIMELKPWVMNLRTTVYEAEDVMDMYEYNHLQAQVSPPPANCLEKIYRESDKFFPRNFFAPVTLKTELKKSLEAIQKAATEADTVFGPLIASPSASASSTVPSDIADRSPSVPSPSSKIFGREDECKSIVDMLISEGAGPSNISESRIPILAIWGIGGSGKTSLAQLICNDPRIKDKLPLRLWVDLSRQLDVLKATTEMLVYATKTQHPPKESLEALQTDLKKHLESNKKFLVVLDDVWLDESQSTQNRLLLDQLLIPFNEVRDICSKILITTRAERTAELIGAKHRVHIEALESKHCWSIIEEYAREDFQKKLSDDPELKKIGDQIVDKLKHSPLAATLVGIRMGIRADVNPWRIILEGDILKDAWNASLWSYKRLPQHLQQCFSFCSLFPKGWIFDESELIRLWIAEGFVVVPSGSRSTMEDQGGECFNELLSFAFFQRHPQYSKRYVMHDVLHDLAKNVSQDHCFRIEGDTQGTIPATVVHLSVNVANMLVVDIPKILELVNLRTFFIISLPKVDFINLFLDASNIFSKLKKLRILHLGKNTMLELHRSICELTHIRYLQLSHVRTLPESLGRLYHLHFLVLDNDDIEIMPKSLSNLINLKWFDAHHVHKIVEVPEFGKLTSLQRLEAYNASRRSQCGIDQLKNLRELRGSLRIGELQNIESKEEACEAMLKDKTHLDQLALEWDTYTGKNDQAVAAEVLEGLEPPCNLKELEIRSYIGAKSPKWLKNNQCLSNLQGLQLFDCNNLRVLPPLGQLPFLRTLQISNARAVEGIGPEFYGSNRNSISFPRLKVLKLVGMEKWEQWQGAEGVEIHPCLEELVIEDCPKLMEMPSLPPTLRKLQIHNCPSLLQLPPFPCSLEEVEMRGPMGVSSLMIPHDEEVELEAEGRASQYLSLKKIRLIRCSFLTHLDLGYQLTTLQAIVIDGCEGLRSLILGHQLTALQSLCISGCENLGSLVGVGLLPSLQRLEILNCGRLTLMKQPDHDEYKDDDDDDENDGVVGAASTQLALLPLQLPSSLRSIQIKNCKELSMHPGFLLGLTSLTLLAIEGCPSLQSLPDLIALEILRIEDCPELTSIGNLHCLEWLTVTKCPKLTRLGRGGGDGGGERDRRVVSSSVIKGITIDETLLLSMLLQEEALNSLQELTIDGSREEEHHHLEDMLPHLNSLLELSFRNCHRLLSLPENLGNLSSLHRLDIRSCPNLKSLPNLQTLSSLKSLYISGCHPELRKKYKRGGPLSHMLSHIPTLKGEDLEWTIVDMFRCWGLFCLSFVQCFTDSANNCFLDRFTDSDSNINHSTDSGRDDNLYSLQQSLLSGQRRLSLPQLLRRWINQYAELDSSSSFECHIM